MHLHDADWEMSQKFEKWKKHRHGIHLCWDSCKEIQTARCVDDEKESFLFESFREKGSRKSYRSLPLYVKFLCPVVKACLPNL